MRQTGAMGERALDLRDGYLSFAWSAAGMVTCNIGHSPPLGHSPLGAREGRSVNLPGDVTGGSASDRCCTLTELGQSIGRRPTGSIFGRALIQLIQQPHSSMPIVQMPNNAARNISESLWKLLTTQRVSLAQRAAQTFDLLGIPVAL
jgi:hypothetical protein